jgi:hypothetical protein
MEYKHKYNQKKQYKFDSNRLLVSKRKKSVFLT